MPPLDPPGSTSLVPSEAQHHCPFCTFDRLGLGEAAFPLIPAPLGAAVVSWDSLNKELQTGWPQEGKWIPGGQKTQLHVSAGRVPSEAVVHSRPLPAGVQTAVSCLGLHISFLLCVSGSGLAVMHQTRLNGLILTHHPCKDPLPK